MIAQHPSTCGLCRDRIIANTDRITRWGVRWVHEDCAARAAERVTGRIAALDADEET